MTCFIARKRYCRCHPCRLLGRILEKRTPAAAWNTEDLQLCRQLWRISTEADRNLHRLTPARMLLRDASHSWRCFLRLMKSMTSNICTGEVCSPVAQSHHLWNLSPSQGIIGNGIRPIPVTLKRLFEVSTSRRFLEHQRIRSNLVGSKCTCATLRSPRRSSTSSRRNYTEHTSSVRMHVHQWPCPNQESSLVVWSVRMFHLDW